MNFRELLTHRLLYKLPVKHKLSEFMKVSADKEEDCGLDEVHRFSCSFHCMQKLKGPVTPEVVSYAKQEAARTLNHLLFGEIKTDLLELRQKLLNGKNFDAADDVSIILSNHLGV